MGPTLIVMKSKAGKVFGGFTKASWQSYAGVYIEDDRSFVFSMDKQ